MINDKMKAKDLSIAGMIFESGNSEKFNTGEWRNKKPIHSKEKCKNCMMCILPCPDNATLHKDGEMIGIDYSKCKGCGVCAKVCPFKAIEMVSEEGGNNK